MAVMVAATLAAAEKARLSAKLQCLGEPTAALAEAAIPTTLGGTVYQGDTAEFRLSARLRAYAELTVAAAAVAAAITVAAFNTLKADVAREDAKTTFRAAPTEEGPSNRLPPPQLPSSQRTDGGQGPVILLPRACHNKAQTKSAVLTQLVRGEKTPPSRVVVEYLPPAV